MLSSALTWQVSSSNAPCLTAILAMYPFGLAKMVSDRHPGALHRSKDIQPLYPYGSIPRLLFV